MRNCRTLRLAFAALLGTGVCFSASSTFAQYGDKKDDHAKQDHKHDDAKPGGGMGDMKMTPEQMKEMEAWMKAGMPGEPHKLMADHLAGSWDCEVKSWMDKSAPPTVSKGSSENKMIFDGRYLQMTYKGDMMGQPFEGTGTWGYDNTLKKYTGTWMDSMSTCTMFMTGTYDAATKTFTSTGDMANPKDGKTITMREVVVVADKDHHTMEMHMPGPDGKEMKCMEIKYTRK